MADPTNGHDEAALAVAARHALHDEELIAAYAGGALEADGALEAEETARARALVERCVACRDLHADVAALTSAHRATVAMKISAPRDFRLTVEDATRLRPGLPLLPVRPVEPSRAPQAAAASGPSMPSFLQRVRAAVRTVGRPLGGTLVAAGLVGVLIGSISLVGVPGGAPALPLSAEDQAEQPGSTLGAGGRQDAEPGATANAAGDFEAEPRSQDGGGPADDPRPLILAGSIGLVLIGILLLVATLRRPRESG